MTGDTPHVQVQAVKQFSDSRSDCKLSFVDQLKERGMHVLVFSDTFCNLFHHIVTLFGCPGERVVKRQKIKRARQSSRCSGRIKAVARCVGFTATDDKIINVRIHLTFFLM